jgi:hypothetical protein
MLLPLFGHFSFVLLCLERKPLSFLFLFVDSVMYFPPPPFFEMKRVIHGVLSSITPKRTCYLHMLFKERIKMTRFHFTSLCLHALRLGSAKLFALLCEPFAVGALLSLHSEEGCVTSAVEMLAIDF